MTREELLELRWRKAGISEETIEMALDLFKRAAEYRKLRQERINSITDPVMKAEVLKNVQPY